MEADINLHLLRGQPLSGEQLLWLLITGHAAGAKVEQLQDLARPAGRARLTRDWARGADLSELSSGERLCTGLAVSMTLRELAQQRMQGPPSDMAKLAAMDILATLQDAGLPDDLMREVEVIPGAARARFIRTLGDADDRLAFLQDERPDGEAGGWWMLAAEMSASDDLPELALLTSRVSDPELEQALQAWETAAPLEPGDLREGLRLSPEAARAAETAFTRLEALNPDAPLPLREGAGAPTPAGHLHSPRYDLLSCLISLRAPGARRGEPRGTLLNLWLLTRLEPLLTVLLHSSWSLGDLTQTRRAELNLAAALIQAGAERPWTAPLQTLLRTDNQNQSDWAEAAEQFRNDPSLPF